MNANGHFAINTSLEDRSLNIRMSQEHLVATISAHADAAREGRQVAGRMLQLLPQQFLERKRRYAQAGRMSKAERLALVDVEYLAHLEQLTTVRMEAWASRIQYETHLMLAHARQSINAARRRQLSSPPSRDKVIIR